MKPITCPPIRATTDPTLNEALIGTPAILVPKQSLQKPVEVAAASRKVLDFKSSRNFDFLISHLSMALYRLGGSPGSRTVTRIAPDDVGGAGAAADVRLTFKETGTRRHIAQGVPWSTIAGNATTPHVLGIPARLNAGRHMSIEVVNNDNSNGYAVALQMHGLHVAAQDDLQRHHDRLQRRHDLLRPRECEYLVPNNDDNARGVGIFALFGAHDVTLGTGNYDTPSTVVSRVVVSQSRYAFIAQQIVGRQRVSGTVLWQTDNAHPVLARVYDQDGLSWLCEGFVPIEVLAGWAGEPNALPVEWAWRPKSRVSIDFKSMHSAAVISDVTFVGALKEVGYR